MEQVNIHFNGNQVGTGVMFQRVPVVGEHVAYQGQWLTVSWVGHDWLNGSPIAGISIAATAQPAQTLLDTNHSFSNVG